MGFWHARWTDRTRGCTGILTENKKTDPVRQSGGQGIPDMK